jgi:hypothetical protein
MFSFGSKKSDPKKPDPKKSNASSKMSESLFGKTVYKNNVLRELKTKIDSSNPVNNTIKDLKSKVNKTIEEEEELKQKLKEATSQSLNIIDKRKSLKKAKSRSMMTKTFYSSSTEKKKNQNLQKKFNNMLSKKISETNNEILNKINKSDISITPNIETGLYNIYRNDNVKKEKLLKILKKKDINRKVSKTYGEKKKGFLSESASAADKYLGLSYGAKQIGLSSAAKYIGRKTGLNKIPTSKKFYTNSGRHLLNATSSFSKYSGLSSAASTVGKYSGLSYLGKKFDEKTGLSKSLSKYAPVGAQEKIKQLKADIQILRKEKQKLGEKYKKNINNYKPFIIDNDTPLNDDQIRINQIIIEIDNIKQRIKQLNGINYNETVETYENIMSANTSKFDLDGEYKKLLVKKLEGIPNNFYNNLLNRSNISNLPQENKNKLKKPDISVELFENDNSLFRKFSESVPYSEYNFLYGIDKHSQLDEERAVAFLYATKIAFAFALEPHLAIPTTFIVIALLLSRFALDYYRKYKMSLKKNLVFCTKYFPFPGIEHYASELISKYHKIFYYGVGEKIADPKIKNDKFYESVIELTHEEEEEFIKKNILFIKYLDIYQEDLNTKIITGIDNSINKNDLSKLEDYLGDQVDLQEKNAKKEEAALIAQQQQANNESEKGTPADLSTVLTIEESNKTSVAESNQPYPTQNGGGNLKVLINNSNKGSKKGRAKLVNKKITEQFSAINKASFRLNHIIEFNTEGSFFGGSTKTLYILTSGDISIQFLFMELKPIINCRATFLEGELKPLSKSIPFFTNDYLTNLLDTIARESTKYATMESTRIFIIDFIKEYIENFTKLYQLAKYNILLLLNDVDQITNSTPVNRKSENISENNSSKTNSTPVNKKPTNNSSKTNTKETKPTTYTNKNLLLKELFKVNLSYTFRGRYRGIDENDLKEVQYRDILNYYCILLKYCQIALDHIHKRFKISIKLYDDEEYNSYNKAEMELNNFFNKRLGLSINQNGKKKVNVTDQVSWAKRAKRALGFAIKEDLNPYSKYDKNIKSSDITGAILRTTTFGLLGSNRPVS